MWFNSGRILWDYLLSDRFHSPGPGHSPKLAKIWDIFDLEFFVLEKTWGKKTQICQAMLQSKNCFQNYPKVQKRLGFSLKKKPKTNKTQQNAITFVALHHWKYFSFRFSRKQKNPTNFPPFTPNYVILHCRGTIKVCISWSVILWGKWYL